MKNSRAAQHEGIRSGGGAFLFMYRRGPMGLLRIGTLETEYLKTLTVASMYWCAISTKWTKVHGVVADAGLARGRHVALFSGAARLEVF
jgi:hypothetical protein